eukprot:TRINITY_DN11038_c0_g1_i2.p1 TRINITY_DN11038_c0_g1~~TRINITY_DN11038_c0_g1_i2.p1  ORF type:complete len:292 (-),score=47.09 TRINITY_DN11038_c0_g1_i2:42-917(-)
MATSSSSSSSCAKGEVELQVCWLSGEPLAIIHAQPAWTESQLHAALQQQLLEAGTLRRSSSPKREAGSWVPSSPSGSTEREPCASSIRSLLIECGARAMETSDTVQGLGLQPGDVLFAIAELPPLEKSLIRILGERQHLTDDEAYRLVVRADASEINVKDQEQTPLHLVADRGFTRACRALLNHHLFTEANAKDGSGFTALHWAALGGWVEVCSILLDHPRFSETTARTLGGQTALHFAVGRSHVEVCRRLAMHSSFSPALQVKDNRGRTALQLSEGIIRELLLKPTSRPQ